MNESYKLKLNSAMEHYKIDSLAELKDEDQKAFFSYVDSLEEGLTAGQKKLPAGLQKAILAKQGKKDDSKDETHDKKEIKEEDAYENDRYIIKNGKATLDNSNTPDKKNHVYADGHKDAEKKAKEKGIKEDLVGGQKKLDKDKDGDLDAKDFAALRKDKTEDHDCDKTHPNESHKEYTTNKVAKEYMNMSASKNKMKTESHGKYLQTKPGSLEEAVLKARGLIK